MSSESDDIDFTKTLADAFAAEPAGGRKLRIWLDAYEIAHGDNIIEKLNDGLAPSRFFVLVLSRSVLEAKWPTGERNASIYEATSRFGPEDL